MEATKLWTKNFFIDSFVNFFIYIVFYLFMVVIVAHVMTDLKGSSSTAGLVFGIFVVGLLVSRLTCGSFIETVGDKKMLYIGLTVFLFTTLLYFPAKDLASLLVVRFVNGLGMGIATTATGTIIAKIIPPARRGEGTGYFALTMPLASAIGSSLGIYINHYGNFNTILILSIILLGVSFVGAFFLETPETLETPENEVVKKSATVKKTFAINNFFEVSLLPLGVICIFMGVSYSGILSFFNSYSASIGQVKAGGIFFIVYAFFILLSRPFTGKWFDRKGENFVMYPAFALFALGLVVLGVATNAFMIFLTAALIGFGYGTFQSSAQAMAVKGAPTNRMGIATSTFYASLDLGVGVGPFLLGLFVPIIGYRPLYLILAAIAGACLVIYFFVYGRKSKEKKQGIKIN